jgi:hypothetical protein
MTWDRTEEPTMSTVPLDENLEAWDQFVVVVRRLRGDARPELTLADALREALDDWCSEQAALYHGDRPFQP